MIFVKDCLYLRNIHMLASEPPSVMVLREEDCGRLLGHGGGAFMSGISSLMKEAPESSLALRAM